MRVEVLLFAAAKERAGTDSILIEVDEPAVAADVLRSVGNQVPSLAELLPSCRLAVDCEYVTKEYEIGEDQEVALIPPVSGG